MSTDGVSTGELGRDGTPWSCSESLMDVLHRISPWFSHPYRKKKTTKPTKTKQKNHKKPSLHYVETLQVEYFTLCNLTVSACGITSGMAGEGNTGEIAVVTNAMSSFSLCRPRKS